MQYKKVHKHTTTALQATCLQLLRFSKGKDILLQVHSLDCLVCDLKGKTEQATVFRKNSVSDV